MLGIIHHRQKEQYCQKRTIAFGIFSRKLKKYWLTKCFYIVLLYYAYSNPGSPIQRVVRHIKRPSDPQSAILAHTHLSGQPPEMLLAILEGGSYL